MSGNALKDYMLEAVPSWLVGCHQHVLERGEFVQTQTAPCLLALGMKHRSHFILYNTYSQPGMSFLLMKLLNRFLQLVARLPLFYLNSFAK